MKMILHFYVIVVRYGDQWKVTRVSRTLQQTSFDFYFEVLKEKAEPEIPFVEEFFSSTCVDQTEIFFIQNSE